MKRPTFFLSSTIYDFRDLRSALKFYLEKQGCTVLASEFNDFKKPLDEHSYQACLDAIKAADYFILLIGGRVGGWFDKTARVSITQQEYREAYKLHQAGKLKLITFVRSEVWQIKEERRELAKYLESLSIEDGLKNSIANFTSKHASDAEFLSSFIAEVGRNSETKLAVETGGPAPSGNWINIFSGFDHVVSVIDGVLLGPTPIEDMTLKRLLRREVWEFLKQTLVKFGQGEVHSPMFFVKKFHEESTVTLNGRKDSVISVNTKSWDTLSTLSIHLLGLKLHPVVLPRATSAPTFLEFNLQTDAFQETPVYEALLLLQSEIRKLTVANTSETLSVVFEHSRKNQANRGTDISINTMKLAAFLHLLDRWVNVIELSRSIVRHLDGDSFSMPSLRPETPITGMQESLDLERPTDSEIDSFVQSQ